MPQRLVILDRDGVINHESDQFVKTLSEWRAIDGSIDAIAKLSRAGFTVAVASNQSGVGRGLIKQHALDAMHHRLRFLVREAGGEIGEIVYCPHHPDDECACRKPQPGLLRKLADHYETPLENVPVIGDSARDLKAAQSVHARPILVLTGNGETTADALGATGSSVETFADLRAAAAQLILESKSEIV